jgi:hypothetical protein
MKENCCPEWEILEILKILEFLTSSIDILKYFITLAMIL